jgi:hypothetical protein
LQSGDYELLVRNADDASGEIPGHWLGWRRKRVIDPLMKELSG